MAPRESDDPSLIMEHGEMESSHTSRKSSHGNVETDCGDSSKPAQVPSVNEVCHGNEQHRQHVVAECPEQSMACLQIPEEYLSSETDSSTFSAETNPGDPTNNDASSTIDTDDKPAPPSPEIPSSDNQQAEWNEWFRHALKEGHWSFQAMAVVLSCFLSYAIVHRGERLDSQIATMIVIVLVGSTHPQLITATGVGVFAGAGSSEDVIPNWSAVLLVSIVAALTWLAVAKSGFLLGFGGRLGSTTFIAVNLTITLILGPSDQVSWDQYGFSRGDPARSLWSDLTLEYIAVYVGSVVFLSVAGSACRFVAAKVPPNPVLAPSAVALLAMLVVSIAEYELAHTVYLGFATGSYVAMAARPNIPDLFAWTTAGFCAGAWGVFLTPFFLGFGGKAGFTAMLGFSTYRFLLSDSSIFKTIQRAQDERRERLPR